jgi:hypothetical protein
LWYFLFCWRRFKRLRWGSRRSLPPKNTVRVSTDGHAWPAFHWIQQAKLATASKRNQIDWKANATWKLINWLLEAINVVLPFNFFLFSLALQH